MLSWFKKRAPTEPDQPKPDPRWGDYEGEGIWFVCPDCEALHEVTDVDFLNRVKVACTEISATTQQLYDAFDFGNPDGRWDVDPELARFHKTAPDGRRASGAYAVVESWNETSHSWLWSWEMGDEWMPAPAKSATKALKALCDAEGWEITTARNLLLNEEESWHITNLAAQAAGFPAVYRAKVNDINHHYFIIDHLKWEVIQ
jgi:hypothetical protein